MHGQGLLKNYGRIRDIADNRDEEGRWGHRSIEKEEVRKESGQRAKRRFQGYQMIGGAVPTTAINGSTYPPD